MLIKMKIVIVLYNLNNYKILIHLKIIIRYSRNTFYKLLVSLYIIIVIVIEIELLGISKKELFSEFKKLIIFKE